MVRRIRLRPTYASATATVALFIALGGGAYAAATLPANSVGAKQIKKGAVERPKIKNNAVDGSVEGARQFAHGRRHQGVHARESADG